MAKLFRKLNKIQVHGNTLLLPVKRLLKSLASLCKVQLLMFETMDNKNKFYIDICFLYIQFLRFLSYNQLHWLPETFMVSHRYVCANEMILPTRRPLHQRCELSEFFFISFLKWKKVTYINDVYNLPYYSFKIFPGSWLVKTTYIIHYNQLLLIKFGKNFVILNGWRQNDIKSAAWLQVIEALTKKTWGQGWVVLVVRTKWRNCHGTFHSFQGKILSKNIVRTARRQLNRQYLLFGVYLQTRADLNLVNFPIKMHYRYELTSTEVSMF